MLHNSKLFAAVLALAAACLLTGCLKDTVFYHYEHTPSAGWEKNDPVEFSTGQMAGSGSYQQQVGLTVSRDYPFRSLTIIVEQRVFHKAAGRAVETLYDRLDCKLMDSNGNMLGDGISQYQYLFPLRTLDAEQGDSIAVSIHHDMKREILPGIINVGMRMSRK